MRSLINSFYICLSTFSVIPTKNVNFDEDNMKYVFCFFPLIGIIIGLIEYYWFVFCHNQGISSILYSSISTVIPILITGGIHIDGLIDTFDAIFCYGDTDKRLNVLTDSRVGAFGVIYTIIYFIITFGVFESIFNKNMSLLLFIDVYVISRITSGIITLNFPEAKDSGLQKVFNQGDKTKLVTIVLSIFMLLILLANSFKFSFIVLVSIVVFYSFFYKFCKKLIGGLAGDLIGFSLTIFELLLLILLLLI